ncbi:MAG: 4Fe-4S dicluster domain-containing protein [Deferrisomatales bacterium]|nr:4Fe-4S dicluster domain-containing protein [Deferrisomatales bacterium]
MNKTIMVDQEKCTGCRLCEMVCSVNKEGAANPARSRIKVIKWETEGFYLPMFCQHCDEPVCETVCPVNGVSRDCDTGRVSIDQELCIGCRSCVSACPMGGVGFDSKEGEVLRCDQCGGDPTCVKFCETKALQYVAPEKIQSKRMRAAAEKLYRTYHGGD